MIHVALLALLVETPNLPSRLLPNEYTEPSLVRNEICFYDALIETISNGRLRGTGVVRHLELDLESRLSWLLPHTKKSEYMLIITNKLMIKITNNSLMLALD